MMLLEPEVVIKRTAIAIAAAVIAAGFGLTYYFARNFNTEIAENKTEAATLKETLKDETHRLTSEADSIKTALTANTRDLKTSITLTAEETKKLDTDLRSQSQVLKQLLQDYEKYKSDVKSDFTKLRMVNEALLDQLKARDQYYGEQIKIRDGIIEKNKLEAKTDTANLHELLRAKDREIVDLKSKLDKEIEWRNKNIWNR